VLARVARRHVGGVRHRFAFLVVKNAMAVRRARCVGWRADMREGHVISDGEAVGRVRLSVHYKNSGMFMAHDAKAHVSLQRQNAHGNRA
jgi:hypothetical protein